MPAEIKRRLNTRHMEAEYTALRPHAATLRAFRPQATLRRTCAATFANTLSCKARTGVASGCGKPVLNPSRGGILIRPTVSPRYILRSLQPLVLAGNITQPSPSE